MIGELLPVKVLSARLIPNVSQGLREKFGFPAHIRAIALLSTDCDDATYIALDEATKKANVEVVYARSLYAGAANASTALAGEVIGILGGENPSEVRSGLQTALSLLESIGFRTANDSGDIVYLSHCVSRTGSYLSAQAHIPLGQAIAYLIAPPVEAVVGLDAALKASDVELTRRAAEIVAQAAQAAGAPQGAIGCISTPTILVLAPVLANLLRPVLVPVYGFLGADPAMFAGTILANDMGGAPLAFALAQTKEAAQFGGLLIGSMLGATVVFIIPVALGIIREEDRPALARGVLAGIITVPVGALIGGLVAGFPILMILKNLIPIVLFALLIALGLWKFERGMIRGFLWFGRGVVAVITVGLAAAVFERLTGVTLIPGIQ